MSDSLFRALLRAPEPTPVGGASSRYRSGLVSSYLQQAELALVAAEAMTLGPRRPQDREILVRETQRAAVSLCKAIRAAHGLSPTRERDLKVLVFGNESTRAIPDGPWRDRVRGVVMIGCLLPETEWTQWITRLQHLLQDASHLGPPRITRRIRLR